MSWTWRLEGPDGTVLDAPVAPSLANQSDAESWLGEQWHTLRDDGVAQVTLLDGGAVVYGPMSLADA
jgi:hypothetical protein